MGGPDVVRSDECAARSYGTCTKRNHTIIIVYYSIYSIAGIFHWGLIFVVLAVVQRPRKI